MMPSYKDLIEITLRLLALSEAAGDMLAMPAPEWEADLEEAKADLDTLLATMEG